MKLGIFQIKTKSKKMSLNCLNILFLTFFYQHPRQIALKSNEKAKEKLYPLLRLIKDGKTTDSIGQTGMKKKIILLDLFCET